MDLKYGVLPVIFAAAIFVLRKICQDNEYLQQVGLYHLVGMTVLVFVIFGWFGLKEPFRVLVIGDQISVQLFEKYAGSELAKVAEDKRVVFYTAEADEIPDEPYDAIFNAVSLRSLQQNQRSAEREVRSTKRKAVQHFGPTIYRHMITVFVYDHTFAAPSTVPEYLETYSPKVLKDLLEKCNRRWVDLCLGPNLNKEQCENLKQQIATVTAENCGPIKHRIILLGSRESQKYKIGNMILNHNEFSDSETTKCVAKERVVSGKRVMIVNTPAIHAETAGNPFADNQIEIGESLLLTSPGPRVFVMVLNDSDTPQHMEACFQVFENRFGTDAYSHLIVILNQSQRHENTLPAPLRQHINIIRHYGDCELENGNYIEEAILTKVKELETKKKELSITLIGPGNMGKSHTANSLLGVEKDGIFRTRNPNAAVEENRTSVALRSACGFDILIADTPSIGTDRARNQSVLKEINKAAFYPDGSRRPIVIVLRGDRADVHPDDKACLDVITHHFSEHLERTCYVMFTRKEYQDMQFAGGLRQFLDKVSDFQARGPNKIRDLLMKCHWRCLTFENEINNGRERDLQNKKVFEVIEQMLDPYEKLNVVLVGRTGTGKTSTANTIMLTADIPSQTTFRESSSQMSETETCQFKDLKIGGRTVRLIDTPGLFDTRTQYSNDQIMEELVKCMIHSLPGPHAFLLTVDSTDRFTEEDEKTLRLLKQTFGDDMLRYILLTLTRLDGLQRDDKSGWDIIDEIVHGPQPATQQRRGRRRSPVDCANRPSPLSTIENFESGEYVLFNSRHCDQGLCNRDHSASWRRPTLSELLQANGKYVALANCDAGRRGKQALGLLAVIEQMKAINGHKHFSNRLYADMIRRLQWFGTGSMLNMRYQFERNPAVANAAVGIITGLLVGGAGIAAAPAVAIVGLSAFTAYIAGKIAP